MRQIRKQIALGAIAALVGAIAIAAAAIFFCFALYFTLSTAMSPGLAAMISGIAILAIAAVVIGLVRWAARPRVPAPGPRPSTDDIAAELGDLLGREARAYAARHAGGTVVSSLVLGFLVGVSPGLRDVLRRALF